MNATRAAAELGAIRDARHGATADLADLAARVDAIGQWAARQKHSRTIGRILEECHRLRDRLDGGSGKGGIRLEWAAGDGR